MLAVYFDCLWCLFCVFIIIILAARFLEPNLLADLGVQDKCFLLLLLFHRVYMQSPSPFAVVILAHADRDHSVILNTLLD